MTTHNTHSEHSDVEVSVAEHQHASESATSSPSSELTTHIQESDTPPQPAEAALTDDQTEASSAKTDYAELAVDTSTDTGEASHEAEEEGVLPFTAFIEEFRQAEARLSSSLQAYASEALSTEAPSTASAEEAAHASSISTPVESTDEQVSASTTTPSVDVQGTAEEHPLLGAASPMLEQPAEAREPSMGEVAAQSAVIPSTLGMGEASSATSSMLGMAEASSATTNSELPGETATRPTRPVSPLLRPASRLRLPRHGVGRQREEASVSRAATPEVPLPAPTEEPKVEPTVREPAAIEEQPKPARRYRFDRPAASTTNGSATTPSAQAQPRAEETKDTDGRGVTSQPSRTDTSSFTNGQSAEKEVQTSTPAKSVLSTASISEQTRQPVVQDTPVAESLAPTATPPTQEHDRRKRHGQERQRKEQPTTIAPVSPAVPMAAVPTLPTTPAELVPTIAEPTIVQAEEVNPEDLPPLEYAELQKANSRRRRRRHPGNTVAVPTPVTTKVTPAPAETTPLSPVSTPVPAVAMPRTPVANSTPANQYAITSGYTVSQMNKGNEVASPFMGPEPSPARGSIAAQSVRSIRTDVQRTPAYPVRTTEATSASVQQLASVVAQAIQTQTDRMVSELRRANQSPTNVSVSMPPFPSTERVGVFVDVANLLYSARNLRMTVDFGKLLDFLRGNRRLVRAQAYCPTSPQPGDEQMFLQAVKGLGYRITTKNYKTFSSGAKKADLDLDLCMDVVRLVDGKAVDCIVLVSGDSDFMPMLDYCSDHGVRVEVAAFDESMSATLRQSCDLFINLGMLDEIRA